MDASKSTTKNIKMTEYINRYILWWQVYHPGLALPQGMQELAIHICEIIICHKISYEKFNEILTALEEEHKELPYNFSVVAYCLDYIAYEKQEEIQNQAFEDSKPIILPQEGKSIRLVDNPRLQNALKRIKKSNPELLKILERINLHRTRSAYHVCAACNNTGFIIFGCNYNENKIVEEFWNISKVYDFTKVKRCQCSKGQNLSGKCSQVTKFECEQAAINGGDQFQNTPF